MKKIVFIIYLFLPTLLFAQGKANNFLIGHNTITDQYTTSGKGRLSFNDTAIFVVPDNRKMSFGSAQGNISDDSGNLLIVSNGCWIADATGDTMQNGNGLTPLGSFTTDFCDSFGGIPFSYSSLIVPYPNNGSRYILFHQTGDYSLGGDVSPNLMYSEIDLSLNGGLGAVTLKSQVLINEPLFPGVTACKHANGRDWWIVAFKDNSSKVYKILLTPNGIDTITSQILNVPSAAFNGGQPTFSKDGKKFMYSDFYGTAGAFTHNIRLMDFDRCSGIFSNEQVIDITDSVFGYGLSFSPDSKYLYASSFKHIFQMCVDSPNVALTKQIVATNDVFTSPVAPFYTNFFLMYLAANGKIYISSGNGVTDYHYINYPDNAGTACDVHLHDLHLPCYSFRGNVNHPNYYLGCDTTSGCPCLTTSIHDQQQHDFKFSISPNPTNSNIKIMYLLPQNSKGLFEVYDVTGKKVYQQQLPPWSTLQNFDLSFLSNGVYNCIITSATQRVSKKLAVIKN